MHCAWRPLSNCGGRDVRRIKNNLTGFASLFEAQEVFLNVFCFEMSGTLTCQAASISFNANDRTNLCAWKLQEGD